MPAFESRFIAGSTPSRPGLGGGRQRCHCGAATLAGLAGQRPGPHRPGRAEEGAPCYFEWDRLLRGESIGGELSICIITVLARELSLFQLEGGVQSI